jgi:photosystem II stability/assembly factor-like uncharacterized protein
MTALLRSAPAAALLFSASILCAAETAEEKEKTERFRAAIPLGGNFQPKKEEGVFVAAGHGLRVVASRDDGKTWEQVFYAGPGGDHGPWAVWNSVAYTEGVFAVAAGWGAVGTIIASDDGKNWRHLAGSDRKAARGGKPYDMPTTMQMLGVDGHFILPLQATPDFGKTWHAASAYGFKDAQGEKVKADLSHPSMAFGQGRVIVVGDAGPSLYSDDFGKTWSPLSVKVSPWAERGSKGLAAKGDVWILVRDGATVLRSTDKGMTWTAHPLGVEKPEGRSYCVSVVGDEFWVTGKNAKASKDGLTWRDLPKTTPAGRIAVSDKGTLINVSRSRNSILRSADGGKTWETVFTFKPEGSGGAQGLGSVEFGYVRAAGAAK